MKDFIHRSVPLLIAEQATLRQIEKIIIQSGKALANYNLPVTDEFIDCFSWMDQLVVEKPLLPVVKRVQLAEIVESCIKCSLQWVQKFALTENMRVQDGEGEFSQWLPKLGDGTIPVKEEDPFKGCIEIPNQCVVRENESVVERIFGDAQQNDYSKRMILTPTNVDLLSINEEVLECLPGLLLSSSKTQEESYLFLSYFLQISKLGFINGTRMKVCVLLNNYIDAELAPSDSNLPFVVKRRQFPVRLAYLMAINKSQVQTFDRVGVYLKKPSFSHGQLNVACSRARTFNSLFFKIDKHLIQGMVGEKCYTNNVIFSNVFNL
ncbi:uncharacterized protein LOC136091997 [Hydra vulgaris]|uniref:Uncharacterized protein LOC136091997 n=1 Tax=Hydra vulgaris TaxID=6087 RepID=A0ABM4DML2_HYDVU